jgi:hypothetical protein
MWPPPICIAAKQSQRRLDIRVDYFRKITSAGVITRSLPSTESVD